MMLSDAVRRAARILEKHLSQKNRGRKCCRIHPKRNQESPWRFEKNLLDLLMNLTKSIRTWFKIQQISDEFAWQRSLFLGDTMAEQFITDGSWNLYREGHPFWQWLIRWSLNFQIVLYHNSRDAVNWTKVGDKTILENCLVDHRSYKYWWFDLPRLIPWNRSF